MNSCNFLSEEPQQTLPYNIFQSEPAVPLSSDLTYQLDQNHNLICLTPSTPFQTETHLDSMTDSDDWLPPPPQQSKQFTELICLTPSTPFQTETHLDSMTDTDDWLPPPPQQSKQFTDTSDLPLLQ